MSNLLKLGGKTASGLAGGISISEDGFINVNDTKQESMALGNIVYPGEGEGIRTVFGLKVFSRTAVNVFQNAGKIFLWNDTLYFLDVKSPDSSLYLIDANTLKIKRRVKIGHRAHDFCVDANAAYLFGDGFSTYDLATGNITNVSSTNFRNPIDVYGSVVQDETHIYVGGRFALYKINKANKSEEVYSHVAYGSVGDESRNAVPVIYKNKLVVSRTDANGANSVLEVYDKDTMTLTGRVSEYRTGEGRSLVATKHEVILFGKTLIRSVNTDMGMDSTPSEALSLKDGPTGLELYHASEMDGGFVAAGNKVLHILNEDFSLRASVSMGNLGVFGDVSGYSFICPRAVSDNAGHIYAIGDNEILKLSNELVVKGYRL